MSGRSPSCDVSPKAGDLLKLLNKFENNKDVQNLLKDPDEAFGTIVANEFKMPLDILMYNTKLTSGDVKGLERRLDKLVKQMKKGELSGKMAELFYTTQAFANYDPTVSKLINGYVHIAQHYKGKQQKSNDHQKDIKDAIRREAKARGLMSNSVMQFGKQMTFKTAEDQMRRNEEKMHKLAEDAKNGDMKAEAEYRRLLREEEKLKQTSEMGVYAELIGFIEGPDGLTGLINRKLKDPNNEKKWQLSPGSKRGKGEYFLTKNDIYNLKDKDGKAITSEMANAVHSYSKLSEDLYFSLRDGVDAYIEGVMVGQTGRTREQLKDIQKSLQEKLMPDMQKGFFPHFRRGLNMDFMQTAMARMEDLVLASNKYIKSGLSMDEAIDNMNGFISGHTRAREINLKPEDYSWHFPEVMQSYANNVNRFNYINYINTQSKRAMRSAESMYKDAKYEGGYGESVVNFIQDLHKSATGYDQIKNPAINNIMRSVLAFEFVSKIGFNPRSAARNLSQSLLNFVEWSPLQIKQSRDFFRNKEHLDEVNSQMEEIGILFSDSAPELVESMGNTPGSASSIVIDEATGKAKHVPIMKSAKVANVMSNIAAKSGWMTAKVENFNRKTTYKLAYSDMYQQLDNRSYFQVIKNEVIAAKRKSDAKKGNEYTAPSEKAINKAFENAKKKHAKQFAINSVVGLHYDYNMFSKSKALRGKVGSVVGQFQHYAFKFFEYNWKTGRKGLDDISSMEFNGNNAWKLYRTGLVYFMAPVAASAITGLDFGNLIEHDSYEKVKNLAMAMIKGPDDPEVRKQFHGKGPIMGNIGFPLGSDLLNLGMALKLINLDEESTLSLIAGYDGKHAQEQSSQFEKDRAFYLSRILNTGINRFAYRHLPQLTKGLQGDAAALGWVVQSELGLYPKSQKKKAKQVSYESTSPALLDLVNEFRKSGY